jgi:carboxylesterase type B
MVRMVRMATFLLLALAPTAGALEQRVNVWKGIEYARPPQRWAVAEM